MNIQVGKSYKDSQKNVWDCVLKVDNLHDVKNFLKDNYSDYGKVPDMGYGPGFDNNWCFLIVDHTRKYFESCKVNGTIWNIWCLDEEIVPAEKVPKKFFVVHKESKDFHCVDENHNICLFDNENENRYNVQGAGKINPKYYVKVNITFDEYLELTGLKRKDNLKDCRNKLVESFGCQKTLLTPILTKLEELLTEISKAKNGSMPKMEVVVTNVILMALSDKMKNLGGNLMLREIIGQQENNAMKLFVEYIELFEKQLTKTTN